MAALADEAAGDPHELARSLMIDALNDGTFESSVDNCHVAGMDSVVLFDDRASGAGMLR